ncbi:unnamed protein product [Vitrella brassicaformis CCMP3155]|uniref:K Homology domain-containing protein n=4 Tax=Vitrella brassicaformis TaxID=1169539 RepID=A0A0G4GZ54_VITBC|nr:unnamed protein product [Vitrella brassicaformis CCMP3155]|eukprot:CEM36356.1 unnamed protein product [Vitrella brassicaformis CCMP3155]
MSSEPPTFKEMDGTHAQQAAEVNGENGEESAAKRRRISVDGGGSASSASLGHGRDRFGKQGLSDGPCYLKMLVNNLVAGSIIGKSGAVIAEIEETTGVIMKLSPSSHYFPHTMDRVVVMGGKIEQIIKAMNIILSKVRDVAQGQDPSASDESKLTVKVVVPNSAVSCIIGKGGAEIKRMQDDSGAKIQVSNRLENESLTERVCHISGSFGCIQAAAEMVLREIQSDANLKENLHVTYGPPDRGERGGERGGDRWGGPDRHHGHGHGHGHGHDMMGGYGGPHSPPHQYQQMMTYHGLSGAAALPPQFGMIPPDLYQQHCEITTTVPNANVGSVIGKSGAVLNDIITTSGAKVQISQKNDLVNGTDRRVTISGPLRSVHSAHVLILNRLHHGGPESGGMPPLHGATDMQSAAAAAAAYSAAEMHAAAAMGYSPQAAPAAPPPYLGQFARGPPQAAAAAAAAAFPRAAHYPPSSNTPMASQPGAAVAGAGAGGAGAGTPHAMHGGYMMDFGQAQQVQQAQVQAAQLAAAAHDAASVTSGFGGGGGVGGQRMAGRGTTPPWR